MLPSYHHSPPQPKWIFHESEQMIIREVEAFFEGTENLNRMLENPFDIKVAQRIINSLHSKTFAIFTCFLVGVFGICAGCSQRHNAGIARNQ